METHFKKPSNCEKLEFSLYGTKVENKVSWNYFPIPFEKYIVINSSGKYKYWKELVELAAPFLLNSGFQIVQIKNGQELPTIPLCHNVAVSSIRNISYIFKNSMVVLSDADWVEKISDKVILTSDEMPENILSKLLKVCCIKSEVSINTLLRGEDYGEDSVEIIPNFTFSEKNNIPKEANVSIRCDLFPNWQFALGCIQSGIRTTIIIGKEKIPHSILPFFKNCNNICCRIDKGVSVEQVKSIEKLGINYCLVSKESDKNQEEKFRFFDFRKIQIEEDWATKNLDKLKELPQDTRIKTRRIVVSKEGTFASYFHLKKNLQINSKYGTYLLDGLEDEDFLNDASLFLYYDTRKQNSTNQEATETIESQGG
jgi:hypothetical protein